MNQYKLGVGPMSCEIIGAINSYSTSSAPLMVVASRNQVDHTTGYVCSTQELVDMISNPSILVCRDHCGPYFSNADKGKSLADAVAECKLTIVADIQAGFDLIHIDVSKAPVDQQLSCARQLIEFAIGLNPNILLEFGSEDNTGNDLAQSAQNVTQQLQFIADYRNNIKFFVTQTGSLTMHTQVGQFDVEANKRTAKIIHDSGLLFKEHNADYLTKSDVDKRAIAGVDAMNIAPQLGVIQTTILKQMAGHTPAWQRFAKYVHAQRAWKRWLTDAEYDFDLAVLVGGHYHFNTPEYLAVIDQLDFDLYYAKICSTMHALFDRYTRKYI